MSRQSSVRTLVSFGVKYAPLAYEGLRRGKGPAKEFAEKQVSRRGARTIAMEHAAHLVDGSVLPVYDGDQRVWVVFSGETPVGTHPVVTTPITDLLTHYDLDKRLRPGDPKGARRRRGRRGDAPALTSEGTTTPDATTPDVTTHGPATGDTTMGDTATGDTTSGDGPSTAPEIASARVTESTGDPDRPW